jgi:hypothetical protein
MANLRRFEDCTPEERDARAREDLRRLGALLTASDRLERDVLANDAMFQRDEDAPVERAVALHLFDRAMDLQSAANGITRFHMGFVHVDPLSEPARHARHFALAHHAYFRRLSLGMGLCHRAMGKGALDVLLDEGSPEVGIGPGQWTRFKWNVLHVEHISRAVAARQHRKLIERLLDDDDAATAQDVRPLLAQLDLEWATLRRYLTDDAPGLLFDNALELLKGVGHALLLPVQTEVAGWLGDTRVHRDGEALISSAQIQDAIARTRPGDLLFERRNWYLSNIGLPGFWPHAAMWLGTPVELSASLDDDPSVRAAYSGAFTEFLRGAYPEAWESFATVDEGGHARRVIEAVSEGVVFASAEHTLHADYAAALRPLRSALSVARSIEQAFAYWGRPYDYDFDFFSDQAIVCSELVYKSWEPRPGIEGIAFPLESVLGRRTLPPNSMIAWWDSVADAADNPLRFLWFLDGRESSQSAVWGDERSLRASHQRPKWDLSQE